ncbi:hypothetical protein ABTJ55_19835, partial [Acinetobacter baumannii]
ADTVASLKPDYEKKKEEFADVLAKTGEIEFSSKPEIVAKREAAQKAETAYNDAKNKLENAGLKMTFQLGQLMMLVVTVFLMVLLWFLVMK